MTATPQHIDASQRLMHYIFLVDASIAMDGAKIASLNLTMQELIPYMIDACEGDNVKAKVSVLAMGGSAKWMHSKPIPLPIFQWREISVGGACCLGAALEELNNKLQYGALFQEGYTYGCPCIVLLSSTAPSDDYQSSLAKLKRNDWYLAATKMAVAIGDEIDHNILAEFTDNKEAVLTVHNKEQMLHGFRYKPMDIDDDVPINNDDWDWGIDD